MSEQDISSFTRGLPDTGTIDNTTRPERSTLSKSECATPMCRSKTMGKYCGSCLTAGRDVPEPEDIRLTAPRRIEPGHGVLETTQREDRLKRIEDKLDRLLEALEVDDVED